MRHSDIRTPVDAVIERAWKTKDSKLAAWFWHFYTKSGRLVAKGVLRPESVWKRVQQGAEFCDPPVEKEAWEALVSSADGFTYAELKQYKKQLFPPEE